MGELCAGVSESGDQTNVLAESFRVWVTQELGAASRSELVSLWGCYLFKISPEPMIFALKIGRDGVTSQSFLCAPSLDALETQLPLPRATLRTDLATLRGILLGRIRARTAFLSGRVCIEGDLGAFLKIVSLAKARGVGPLQGG